jgi:hypothetical protein
MCVQVYVASTLVVTAAQPIAEGEEVLQLLEL